MKTPAFGIALMLILLPVPLSAQSDSASSLNGDRHDEFWNRFERKLNAFLDDVTGDFPADDAPLNKPVAAPESSGSGDVVGKAQSYAIDERGNWNGPPHRHIPSTTVWPDEQINPDNVIFRYNRVEGVFIGGGSPKKYHWYSGRAFAPYGSIGYGFLSHRWRGNLGVSRQFSLGPGSDGQLLDVGIEGYSLTDSRDQWLIGTHENTGAAFFIHEDFRDYFGREGATLHASYLIRNGEEYGEATLGYRIDRYTSLDNAAEWSMFGGDKVFRTNPPIDEGRMNSLTALVGYTNATDRRNGLSGWTLTATAEFADRSALGGEFGFHQYIADIRRYQPLGRYDNLNLRVRIGTSHGDLPIQKAFELGGLGTMPAYRFKSFPGSGAGANRMILVNGEYIVNGDFLHDLEFWPSWLMHHVNLLVLFDAGLVRNAAPELSPILGFGGIHWNEFASDAGMGLSNRSGSIRAAVLWRTDRAEPAHFMFRLSRPF
jgi:hypothetical protein